MPLYSFVCPTCGTRFDERLSFQENRKSITCPLGHQGVRRVFSTPTVVYKGKGFYVTDQRKQTTAESNK